jgi:hypothetical protein
LQAQKFQYMGFCLKFPGGTGISHCRSATSQVRSSYITTDGQSASLSWCQAPISDPRLIFSSLFNYFLDSYGFPDVRHLL